MNQKLLHSLRKIGLCTATALLSISQNLPAQKLFKNSPSTISSSTRWIVDKIIARVNGINILKSDLEKPRIEKEGGTNSLQEIILEELLYQKASEKHLLPTSTDVDRQILAFKMQNNIEGMSDAEFEAQLKESGFAVAMYKNQLGRLLAVENIKRAEVSENITVTSQEVENNFKQYPEYTKETYHLHIASLSEDEAKNYKKLISANKIAWKDSGEIEKKDIDPRYVEALSMKKGETTTPIKTDEKYILVKLVDKQERRLKTLDERYGSIERMIQQKKREELLTSFHADLMTKASIVYL